MSGAEENAFTVENESVISRPVVEMRRLRPDAQLPAYQSEGAAGMDVHACPEDGRAVVVEAGEIKAIPCGFAMAVPRGFEAQMRPRSGLGMRHGITLPNAPGTIDSDYRGEVIVVEPGMRIAQMVIAPVAHAQIVEVKELDQTSRGEGGFGSTGV